MRPSLSSTTAGRAANPSPPAVFAIPSEVRSPAASPAAAVLPFSEANRTSAEGVDNRACRSVLIQDLSQFDGE
jgi:hypothetical protein